LHILLPFFMGLLATTVGCICIDGAATLAVEGTLESADGDPLVDASVQAALEDSETYASPVTADENGAFTAAIVYGMYGGCVPFPLSLIPAQAPAPPEFDALLLTISYDGVERTVSVPVTEDMVERTSSGGRVDVGTVVLEQPGS